MSLSKQVYEIAGPGGQMLLDRARFRLGVLPRVNPIAETQRMEHVLPAPYRAAVIISADLELAWAWRYVKHVPNALDYAMRMAEQSRRNFPQLIALFDQFEVPITWATVGHLFLEGCTRQDGQIHPEVKRLAYFENEYWRYQVGDWFDADPGSDHRDAPAWYGPDLVNAILNAKMKHEIACHSFSHIDFTDEVCDAAVADCELQKCKEIAQSYGLSLTSMVFPANLHGNFPILKRHGFTAYRWHSRYELDVPRQDNLGLWQIPGGISWEKRAGWSAEAWIDVLKRCFDRALETGTVLHLWFHPSCDPINVEKIFPAVLDYVGAHRSDVWLTTMAGMVERLNSPAVEMDSVLV